MLFTYIYLLNEAILNRNFLDIIIYLSKVKNLNLPDRKNRLPLSMAACMHSGEDIDYSELIERLLLHGASVNARNRRGQTAIMHAAEHNRLDNLKMLMIHGSDIHDRDMSGKRVLLYAVSHGKVDCALELMNHGAA